MITSRPKVSDCCEADVQKYPETPEAGGLPVWYDFCSKCKRKCERVYPLCVHGICDGSGVTVENQGCCGGCEVCGTREEREVHCPCYAPSLLKAKNKHQ